MSEADASRSTTWACSSAPGVGGIEVQGARVRCARISGSPQAIRVEVGAVVAFVPDAVRIAVGLRRIRQRGAGVARVADAVTVPVGSGGIGCQRTGIAGIAPAIGIGVLLRSVGGQRTDVARVA